MKKKNSVRTSRKLATKAAKVMKDSKTNKTTKSFAAQALVNRKKNSKE